MRTGILWFALLLLLACVVAAMRAECDLECPPADTACANAKSKFSNIYEVRQKSMDEHGHSDADAHPAPCFKTYWEEIQAADPEEAIRMHERLHLLAHGSVEAALKVEL
jgi:hypothetical protein